MADTIENKSSEPVSSAVSIKEKCMRCIKGPHLIKTLIICACIGLVFQQVIVCITKLICKPITTYTHFDFNDTIMYPSVTFCREPPYKFNKMLDYGLYGHPRNTIVWQRFDFNISLDHLWQDITYNESDFFVNYALGEEPSNVAVTETLGFVTGKCYTLSPKVLSTSASRYTGYSVTLQHSAEDAATTTSVYPPGYHLYVHHSREPYTEVSAGRAGLVDYLYVNAGEEVDVKITVDQYEKINTNYDPCSQGQHFSASQCITQHVWDKVGQEAACSGPWMQSTLPYCNNYTQMRGLISTYMNIYENHEKWRRCPRLCRSLLYNAFVSNRQTDYWWDSASSQWRLRTGEVEYQTQLYIHFNSMMVSMYEERHNYDWNIFLSDLGGSIGFLLGLSVISLMKILEKTCANLLQPYIKKNLNSRNNTEIEIENSEPDFVDKCNEWNLKNDLYDKK